MNFKKRIFYTIAAGMLSILLLSYAVMYLYFYRVMFQETIMKQRAYVNLNQQMADNFVQSVYHTAVQIVSDKALGGYLSMDPDDPMECIQIKTAIQTQFSHYSVHQAIDSTYHYRNTLFLSDSLPIAASLETYALDDNPYVISNGVFSNADAKKQDWYQQTVKNVFHIFHNETTDDFCIARRINNNYYLGPHISEGLAVMVVSISMDQLANVFSSLPITPGNGYAVLNEEGKILYLSNPAILQSDYENAWQEYQMQEHAEFTMTSEHKRFLVNYCTSEYGLQMLFLTPDQDIVAGVMPLMYTYSAIFAGIILVTLLVIYLLTNQLTTPLRKLSQAISGIHDTRAFDKETLHVSNDKELMILESSFGHLIDNVNSLIEDIKVQNEKEKRSQLRALQAQINPHFLFNAMDMVNWLALSRNCDDIAQIVSSIANLMRYSITDADGMVDIEQELANIRDFAAIFQQRYHNRLHLETQIQAKHILIPKFTLQPLVENSIRHGRPAAGDDLQIRIQAYAEHDRTIIEVRDNGCGCNAETLNRHLNYEETGLKISSGFGIRNVNERLLLRFGAESGLVYLNAPDGTLVARITLNTFHSKLHGSSQQNTPADLSGCRRNGSQVSS